MPIVLGSFTSSSTKFVDLSYYAQSCSDSMKALQPLLPRMHDEAHQYVVGGKLNNECSTLLFSPLFRKIANMRIFHSERSNHENTYTLLYFAGILFKS